MILRWTFEKAAWKAGYQFVAGIDEVGRGPLTGPVTAAAVILPKAFKHPLLRDSKALSADQRTEVAQALETCAGIAWALGEASVDEIDTLNIYHAALLAMRRALEKLEAQADFLLLDGNGKLPVETPQRSIVGGDAKSPSIAAASILAKRARDNHMRELCAQYPQYGFSRHKGYGTEEHSRALRAHGPCPIHRRSFAPVRSAADAEAGLNS